MEIVLLLLLLAYQIVAAVLDAREMKMLLKAEITEKVRIDWYKSAIIWGWAPVACIALVVALSSMSWHEMGLRAVAMSSTTWLNVIALLFAAFMLILKLGQIIMFLCSGSFREKLAAAIAQQPTEQAVTALVTPRSRKEKVWWFFCSVTAGVGEEIVFRGCLMRLLGSIFPGLPAAVIAIAAAVLFGLFHCYQGLQGIIGTGVMGLMFVLLYLATDSLLPGIALHFLVDFAAAFVVNEHER